MTNRTYRIGQTVTLPDGPTVKLEEISEGVEYGAPVLYLTGTNSFGTKVTRWVGR